MWEYNESMQTNLSTVPRKIFENDYRFALAYIEEHGNATAAAKKVFRLGSRGGNVQRSAESLGSQKLKNPQVQKFIAELLEIQGVSRDWCTIQLKELAAQREDLEVARKSTVALIELLGELPRDQKISQQNVQVVLGIPSTALPPLTLRHDTEL